MGGKHPKAPAGCFWRGDTLHGRTRIKGRLVTWSLRTSDPKLAAARRKAGKDRMIADVFHGDAKRDFVEVMELWAAWINKQVGPKTAQRYACSLDQMRRWLDGKGLGEIDSRLVAEIVRSRSAAGVTNATIKRDLVALSSVINYAIDQGWRDDNPVLPRMRRIKEKREPIVLPHRAHVDLVIARCPGMVADIVRAAIVTGARQDELLKARREHIDHDRRQMALIGKGRKLRVISILMAVTILCAPYRLMRTSRCCSGIPMARATRISRVSLPALSSARRNGRARTASTSARSVSTICAICTR
jgi:integrase/recombinase XerD